MGYKIQTALQRGINAVISFFVILFIIISAAYALFALWDNKRIYDSAQNVQENLLRFKPEDSDPQASFGELLEINPDVRAWLSMENTNIDFPILQGQSNLSYINKDAYGNFALAGSVFLDCRNKADFSDCYSVTYGHHMEGSNMYGDLDRYKEEEFFRSNPDGELILPDRSYKLTAFALLIVKSGDPVIFAPYEWADRLSSNLQYISDNAEFLNQDVFSQVQASENPQILALSTCSNEFTDARTVLLTLMTPKQST